MAMITERQMRRGGGPGGLFEACWGFLRVFGGLLRPSGVRFGQCWPSWKASSTASGAMQGRPGSLRRHAG
eukprot:4220741-Pyramimonas_sp.AAC.1